YPERKHPSRRTFKNLFKQFRNTGNVQSHKRVRTKPQTSEAGEIAVLTSVAVNPHISSRNISRITGISQSSVLRVLHRHKFHPYHVSLHQELHGEDFRNRMEFCEWALQQNNYFWENYLFTDEATFTNHGQVNLRNMHFWAADNPHWIRQVERQRPWSINVWCGIIGDHLIGPFFIEGLLNGQKYANFLLNDLPVLLENISLESRRIMFYQHDGCPAHNARISRAVLNNIFE
ncbi:hypothetical protein EAG_00414, partial [Camponotus floridanus]